MSQDLTMFFSISKIFWGICAPSHILLWLSVSTVMCLLAGRRSSGLILAAVSTLLLIGIGVIPSAAWLLRPLEFQEYARQYPNHVDGILTLGGGNDRILRLIGTYELSRRYPNAVVVFSGGSGLLLDNEPGVDAQFARRTLMGLGLSPERLILEDRSRNTWENLLYTKRLDQSLLSIPKTWILAKTSALQMPRAIEIARTLNWTFSTWPTNWISAKDALPGYFDIPDNLMNFDAAAKEWIGIVVYRFSKKAKTS